MRKLDILNNFFKEVKIKDTTEVKVFTKNQEREIIRDAIKEIVYLLSYDLLDKYVPFITMEFTEKEWKNLHENYKAEMNYRMSDYLVRRNKVDDLANEYIERNTLDGLIGYLGRSRLEKGEYILWM